MSEMSSCCLKCLENGCGLHPHDLSADKPRLNLPPVFKGGNLCSNYSLKSFSFKMTHTLLITHGFQQLVTMMTW